MTNYLITLGFWLACGAAFLLYWRLRLNREERESRERHEREMVEMRARWDAEDATAQAERRTRLAEIEASYARLDEFWIKRGMEPTPREPPEPTEPPESQPE